MHFRTQPRLPRSLSAIAAGRGISFLGDEVAILALAFRAKSQLGHLGVAAIFIAGALPLVLFAPWAGLLVDRLRSRPLLVVTLAVATAISLGLAVADGWWTVALVALLACATAVIGPAWQALVPHLVDPEQLPRAFGRLQAAASVATVAGPFVGGLLVWRFGTALPLVVDAASFAFLAAVAWWIRAERVPAGATGSDRGEAFKGLTFVAREPVLRALTVLAAAFVCALGMINVAELFFITVTLHASVLAYGVIGGLFGIGMLVAASTAGWQAARVPRSGVLVVAGCVACAVAICCLALVGDLVEAGVCVVVAGAANAVINVHAISLLTLRSPEALRGRVMAAVQGVISVAAILALAVGGVLVSWLTPRAVLLAAGIGALVALAATAMPLLKVPAPVAEAVVLDEVGAE